MYIKDNENAEKEVSKISEIVNFIKDYKFDAGNFLYFFSPNKIDAVFFRRQKFFSKTKIS